MKIKRLVIENFKSIERIELIEPNPFTVFVGPNGSGKSNIFEALEFVNIWNKVDSREVFRLFGGQDVITNRNFPKKDSTFIIDLERSILDHSSFQIWLLINSFSKKSSYGGFLQYLDRDQKHVLGYPNEQFFLHFTKLFVGSVKQIKFDYQDNISLNTKASNLEKVLKRILKDISLQEEIFEWLELFVPGFKAVEVDDRDELHWFESSTSEYFTKDLISDGTYNILALLTAIYQSDKPQFLCIEEPENGLNPKVIAEFVNLCRYACEEFGHFIWLNTHSQSLVSQLTTEEIVLVDKRDGATQIKQVKGMNLHDLPMDEAWLSNALGGGIPW